MGEAMPAITLWQPWASLIAHGAKRYETRHWPPPARLIGRRIAIHAAARPVPRDFDAALAQAVGSALGRSDWRRALPFGAVVCTVVMTGGYRVGAPCASDGAAIDAAVPGSAPLAALATDPFGYYARGRWAWALDDVALLDPAIPAKGRQGWWHWRAAGG
jgi:hypothetical protein